MRAVPNLITHRQLVFLRLNDVEPPPDAPAWEALTVAIAAGEVDRLETTARLRALLGRGRRRR